MTLQEIQQKIEEFKTRKYDDFGIYNNSFVAALKAVKESSSTANVKEYEKARQAIEEYFRQKEAEINPQEAALKGIPEVLEYLRLEGWKVSKSKLYEDQLKIDKQKDGSILRKDADKYARLCLSKLDGSDYEIDPFEKLKEETRFTKERADKVAFENEIARGNYILKSDAEQQLSARAAFLKSGVQGFFHSMSTRLIELAEGKPEKGPDVLELCLKETEELFHHYSKPMVFEAVKIKTEETDAV
ncbi:MAG: hypothetical protein HY096_00370 [Nitrospinae bacterium]|nr:hypothetical protein [Nitrospinota bacterium]